MQTAVQAKCSVARCQWPGQATPYRYDPAAESPTRLELQLQAGVVCLPSSCVIFPQACLGAPVTELNAMASATTRKFFVGGNFKAVSASCLIQTARLLCMMHESP